MCVSGIIIIPVFETKKEKEKDPTIFFRFVLVVTLQHNSRILRHLTIILLLIITDICTRKCFAYLILFLSFTIFSVTYFPTGSKVNWCPS